MADETPAPALDREPSGHPDSAASPEVERAADARGRDWFDGPPLTPQQAERARIAKHDAGTAADIARERAGWERDPATGQWRKGSWA